MIQIGCSGISKARTVYFAAFNTAEVQQAWKVTRDFANELGAKIVLFQCPKIFKPSAENKTALETFLKIAGQQSFRLAVEVRGECTKKDIQPFVDHFKIIHAIDPYFQEPTKQDFIFYRLHSKGPSSNPFNYKYTVKDLAELESKLKIRKNGYVFFNNVYVWQDSLRKLRTKPG